MLIAMTGICIFVYMDGGLATDGMWGSMLAVISAASAALFRVRVCLVSTVGEEDFILMFIKLLPLVVLQKSTCNKMVLMKNQMPLSLNTSNFIELSNTPKQSISIIFLEN